MPQAFVQATWVDLLFPVLLRKKEKLLCKALSLGTDTLLCISVCEDGSIGLKEAVGRSELGAGAAPGVCWFLH